MRRMNHVTGRDLPADFADLVRLHSPCAVRDDVAYRNTQEMIDALTSLPRLSRGQREYLDTLTILFEAWEDQKYPVEVSDVGPLDALRLLMEEHGMNASDLGRLLGERSLGPKILNGGRELSKARIRRLVERFGVSADLFL